MGNCLQTPPPQTPQTEEQHEIEQVMTLITEDHTDYNLALSIQNGLYGSLSSSKTELKVSNDNDLRLQCAEKNQCKLSRNGKKELFTEYAPSIFVKLRESFNVSDDDFLSTMTGDDNGLLSFLTNSKSGQFFFFSNNSQFIIKTMSKSELQFLIQILPSYYQYMSNEPNSLIARFYGIYTLHKVKINNNSAKDISFLISNNVFYSKQNISLKYQYDLKGSTQGRKTSAIKEKQGSILKDLNFIENDVRIEISRDNKANIFQHQIFKDCQWFEKHLIMDYSLLVGIADINENKIESNDFDDDDQDEDSVGLKSDDDDDRKQCNNNNNIFYQYHGGMLSDNKKEIYFIGIIDILQKYNKKKKMAGFVKGMKYEQITLSTVPPDIYSKRFCQFFKDRVL